MLESNSILQDRYRILRLLGQGGMGEIYEAIDQRLKSMVALKRTIFDSEDILKAFEREAGLLANLRHAALPKVMDHFAEGHGHYLVMEYIPGNDLAELLALFGRPFSPVDVLRWGDELLKVLEYLHRHNPPILHRDIKPYNLKLTKEGDVFLLDFGLAKGAAGQMPTIGPAPGSVSGYTPSYASLEQTLRSDQYHSERYWVETLSLIDAERVEAILKTSTDIRSDLYSVGATLYHLLTGEAPASAGRRAMYLWKGQPDPVRPASELNPLITDELADVLAKTMALDPDQRPPSATVFRKILREAGQALRIHNNLVGLHQLSQDTIDALVQQSLEQFFSQAGAGLKRIVTLEDATDNLSTRQESVIQEIREIQSVTRKLEESQKELEQQSSLDTETIARRAVALLSDSVVEKIAWEVVPQLAELMIKRWLEAREPPTANKEIKDSSFSQAKVDAASPQPAPVGSARSYGRAADAAELPVEVSSHDERRLHSDARRFARLLVSEIKLYNRDKVEDGRQAGDLYHRLRDDIDRSRQMYDKRVAPSVAARYDYFHQELVNTLADGDPSKLGTGYFGPLIKQAASK